MVTATRPELSVMSILNKLGIEYEYQTPLMGGREQRGGSVADFYIPSLALIISIIGVYWHSDPSRLAQDAIQRTALTGQGITTIYITDEQISRNAKYYVEAALRLEDLSGWASRF